MKKIIALFSALIMVLISSCSSDNPSSTSEDTSVLPKTISHVYPTTNLGTNNTSTITYSGNKIVNNIAGSSKIVFTYDGDVITKQEEFYVDNKGAQKKNLEILYTYENGKLKTRILREGFSTSYPEGQFIYKTAYIHSSDVQISSIASTVDPDTNAETKVEESSLTYKGGNLVKKVETSGNSIYTRVFEYDTKKNPLKNITGFNLLLDEISEYGSNNLVKTTYTTNYSSDTIIYLTSYIYNDKDYPTKNTSLAGDGSVEYEIQYQY